MNCEAARDSFTLYLYGELSFDNEEAFEQHLSACDECRAQLEAERDLHRVLDSHENDPSPELLMACRRELKSRLAHPGVQPVSLLARFRRLMSAPVLLRPVGALALLALGFAGARVYDYTGGVQPGASPTLRVRNVVPDEAGNIRLVLDEVRQKTVTGRLDDDNIRRMLLAAAADPNDPGLRARSLDVLGDRCESTEIRRALLRALQRDPNPGVRLKALEALKPFTRDPETRSVLANVLTTDDNPGVRTQVIDLMVQNLETNSIGLLQELMSREKHPYIRKRMLEALQEANASIETF